MGAQLAAAEQLTPAPRRAMPTVRTVTLLLLGVLVSLAGTLAWLGDQSGESSELAAAAQARRYESFKLGDQMRQTSNDLTRMVRMYVITGEPRYREYYDEILDIRNGVAPRPEPYDSSFWDRVLDHGKHGVTYGPPKSLRTLMQENGITDQEFSALDGSRQYSDTLAGLERIVIGRTSQRPGRQRDTDIALLTSTDYYRQKAQIMGSLDQFLALVDQRTQAEIDSLRERSADLRRWQLIVVGLMLLYSLISLVLVDWLAILPLRRLLKVTDAYRLGHMGRRAQVTAVNEIERLADAINRMAQAIQDDLQRRERLQSEVQGAKDALDERNQMFGRLADAVDVVFWIGSVDFSRWLYVNPAYERLWGWTVEDLYRDPALFMKSVHPDDVATVVQAMSAAGAGGESNVEYRVHTSAGKLRWVWSRAFGVRDAQGSVVFTTGTTTDITDRKAMEARLQQSEKEAQDVAQRLRGLNDNCPGLLLEGHREGPGRPVIFTYVGARAERFYYPHRAEDIQRDSRLLLEAVHPEDRQLLIDQINRTAGEGQDNFMCEYRTRRPDGSYRWVQSVSAQVADPAGTGVTSYGFISDIQVQKALQESLAAARVQAEGASHAKSQFLATMSHEIRTPMIGVTGMLEILSHSRLDTEQRRAVAVIQQSAQSLLQIIGDVLDFSKIEAGKLELAPVTVSLRTLVESVAQNFMPPASSKGLYLEYNIDSALAAAHEADPVRLRQILANFISNALKFTQRGGIEVFARALGPAGAKQRVEFQVTDTGIGVSAENQKKLFQPFSQADSDTTRRFGGTGLGLSICRRLAEVMGGAITMESQEGAGTTLRLRLELGVGDPARIETVAAPVLHKVAGRRPPARAKAIAEKSLLLLVEDHPTNRLVLGQQFALAGFALDIASGGAEALDLWRQNAYALVFTDLHMPGMDGVQLVRAMREAEVASGRARTPVVALTAAALREEAERCLEAGMDDVVVKPTTVPVLVTKLKQWLPHLAWEAAATGPAAATTRGALPAGGDKALLDRRALSELAGGNAGALAEILADFRSSTESDLVELRNWIGGGDAAGVARYAHRLRGASLTVGAAELADVSRNLERAGRSSDWPAIRSLQPKLEDAFERVRVEMKKLA